MALEDILDEVLEEVQSATDYNPPFHSSHEGFAVLLEELEELKTEVFKKRGERSHKKMRDEAIQVAAMAVRFVLDICEAEVSV
jgi:hypothetical protein